MPYPPQGRVVVLPSGLIVMWSGLIANIPSGWIICDGNNGTPNLLAKFVEGVATAATNPGTTGGATAKNTAGHVHTQPTHTHTGPSHTHTVDIYASVYSGSILTEPTNTSLDRLIDSSGANSDWVSNTAGTFQARGKRETTAAGGTGATGAGGNDNVGSNTDSIADIRPLYYDVAFLMKT